MKEYLFCAGLLLVMLFVALTISSEAQRKAARLDAGRGDLHPMYWQARDRSQSELLEKVPANIRRRGLNRAVFTANFTGQRETKYLELYPGEFYEYVQVWNEGRLVNEYVSQNGQDLTKQDYSAW